VTHLPRSKRRLFSVALPTLLAILGCGCSADAQASNTADITIDRGTIHLTLDPGLSVSRDAIRDWVQRAGTAVSGFYGRYPVKAVSIHVAAADAGSVQDGQEFDGDHIEIHLGKDTTPKDLANEWMMTHEMFHLSQPQVDDDYHWIMEGMADYLEPVARVRLGQIKVEQFWRDLVEGMPQGLPQPGDRGLDHTHTWGRTYWGGSLYWLLADIRVRQQTHNAKSVRDAATAVLNAGGDGSQDWELDKLLKAYDAGTGTKVFEALHDEMGDKPVATDLDALWKSLGVVYDSRTGRVQFDEHAPLADIRRGITAK
jgi:hypothetical protein